MKAERLANLFNIFPYAEVRVTGAGDIAVVVTDEGNGVVFNIVKRPSEVALETVKSNT
ncbi:MAG: hypothetical protein LIO53_02005 [Oscillospiraceae bacterium]|nr:hypothetical protein [Oscillospiraceae bacterium]